MFATLQQIHPPKVDLSSVFGKTFLSTKLTCSPVMEIWLAVHSIAQLCAVRGFLFNETELGSERAKQSSKQLSYRTVELRKDGMEDGSINGSVEEGNGG